MCNFVIFFPLQFVVAFKDFSFSDDRSGYKIHLNRCFYDERWSRNRCVTCMDWSPQFPELLVASYHNNEVCSTQYF